MPRERAWNSRTQKRIDRRNSEVKDTRRASIRHRRARRFADRIDMAALPANEQKVRIFWISRNAVSAKGRADVYRRTNAEDIGVIIERDRDFPDVWSSRKSRVIEFSLERIRERWVNAGQQAAR